MNKYLFPLYRVIVPKPVRTIILKKNLRKRIINYFSSLPPDKVNDEQKEIVTFLRENDVHIFPYTFHDDYGPDKIKVFRDEKNGYRYVNHEGKRLYFKKRWSGKRIRKAYAELLREQDTMSPHRYLDEDFQPGKNDSVADIGAAEGNFSLSVIEKVSKIYLFEYDPEWIAALRLTFDPWKDKVEIIKKFVSDSDDEKHTRLDTFYNIHNDLSFVKIDVDGSEQKVLAGCSSILSSSAPLKIALCTYHKHSDEEKFTPLLESAGFIVTPSQGYMINYYDKKLREPYLRRALIRGIRKDKSKR